TNSRIVNYNLPTPRALARVELRLPLEADVGKAERIMSEAAKGIEAVTEAPTVLLKRFDGGAMELTLTCTLAEFADVDRVEDKLRREIQRRFLEAKLIMAKPQMEVAVVERR